MRASASGSRTARHNNRILQDHEIGHAALAPIGRESASVVIAGSGCSSAATYGFGTGCSVIFRARRIPRITPCMS